MIETYTYSIVDDTANGKAAPRTLDQEIRSETAITIELAGVTILGNDLQIDFLAPLSVAEEGVLDAVIAAHEGEARVKPEAKYTEMGVPLVMTQWREGNPTDFISFNWADKTTWYANATPVVSDLLVDSGDGLTFTSSHPFWVDVSNGKIPQEHRLPEHRVSVTVEDVAVTESSTGTTDGDFQVNYEEGTVTFNASQAGSTVRASYSYAESSKFIVEPYEGTTIRITAVEVQFSDDIDLTTSVRFEFDGFVEAFAPHLVNDENPDYVSSFPTGTRIPLKVPRVYKTMLDFIAEAQRAYPVIPALGGSSWRGMSRPVYVMRWPYQEDATRDLLASKGMRVMISLDGDVPYEGSWATCTLYAVSANEE